MKKEKSTSRAVQVLAFNLQIARKKRLLSQEKLANMAQIHRTAMRLIENCMTEATVPTVEKLAKALSMTVSDLLRDSGQVISKDPVFRMPQGVHTAKRRKPEKKASG
jgi:DNA-binding XRE family transcriptional regulator